MTHKILIVDDDLITREMYANRIEEEVEFDAVQAQDGQEAWDYLQENEVSLVFTGIKMPRMNGFELIKQIKTSEEYKNIPIYVSSHMGRPEDKELALNLQASRFITRGKHTPNEVVSMMRAELIGKRTIYQLKVSPSSPDFDAFVDDFFGGPCPNCRRNEQIPIILKCLNKDGNETFEFQLDCERCNQN